jgi:hypothetical protein
VLLRRPQALRRRSRRLLEPKYGGCPSASTGALNPRRILVLFHHADFGCSEEIDLAPVESELDIR